MMPNHKLLEKGFSISVRGVFILGVLALASGCMPQLIKSDSIDALHNGEYEKSLAGLKAGLAKYPNNTELKAAYLLAEEDVGKRLVAKAQSLIAQAQYGNAKDG
jgi:hypothetical protein